MASRNLSSKFPPVKMCPNFPGYSASADGRIFSHIEKIFGINGKRGCGIAIRVEPMRELTRRFDRDGYAIVTARRGHRVTGRVHQMVLDAFVGPMPTGAVTRHLDGVRTNNRIENLCYGTAKENAADTTRHGHWRFGMTQWKAKLTDDQVREIRTRFANGETNKTALAREFGVSDQNIGLIIRRLSRRFV